MMAGGGGEANAYCGTLIKDSQCHSFLNIFIVAENVYAF